MLKVGDMLGLVTSLISCAIALSYVAYAVAVVRWGRKVSDRVVGVMLQLTHASDLARAVQIVQYPAAEVSTLLDTAADGRYAICVIFALFGVILGCTRISRGKLVRSTACIVCKQGLVNGLAYAYTGNMAALTVLLPCMSIPPVLGVVAVSPGGLLCFWP